MSFSSSKTDVVSDKSLVSFVVFAYQQERYIRDAVKGALEQSYSPLEIILSDDHSQDRTFDIMKEMAGAYRGPHKVVLNRNPSNMGMGSHVSRCMELAEGELVVAAAGDDVSMPHRTETLVKAWISAGRPAGSIHSAYVVIDEHGNEYGARKASNANVEGELLSLCDRQLSGVIGATHAWHRSVFEQFGPLNADIAYEDQVIPVRSRLIGGVVFVPDALVYYRRAAGCITYPGQNLSIVERRRQKLLHQQRWMSVYCQWELDFRKAPCPPKKCLRFIDYMKARARLEMALHEHGMGRRFIAFLRAMKYPENWRRCALVYPWYAVWALGNFRVKQAWIGKGWHEILAKGPVSGHS